MIDTHTHTQKKNVTQSIQFNIQIQKSEEHSKKKYHA